MDLTTWTAYAIATLLIAISPGSGAVLAMSHGLSFGVKRSHATIAGLQVGMLLLLLIAGVGVGSLLVASELAFSVIKALGAAYLIYIGVSQWRSKAGIAPVADGSGGGDAALVTPQAPPSGKQRFLSGFLTNMTNPKGILFMVAVLPQFISPNRPLWLQLLVIAVTSCVIDTAVMHGYAFAASRLQAVFKNARAIRLQNQFFGGLMMSVGVGLLFVKRHSPGA